MLDRRTQRLLLLVGGIGIILLLYRALGSQHILTHRNNGNVYKPKDNTVLLANRAKLKPANATLGVCNIED